MTQIAPVSVADTSQASRVLTFKKNGGTGKLLVVVKEDPPGNGRLRSELVFPVSVCTCIDKVMAAVKALEGMEVSDVNVFDGRICFWSKKRDCL